MWHLYVENKWFSLMQVALHDSPHANISLIEISVLANVCCISYTWHIEWSKSKC